MSDPRDPDTVDARDERIAALLAVPPLDEVTRRRLVDAAIEPPRARSSRLAAAVSVAAALVVGALAGTLLVQEDRPVTTAQGGTGPTADLEALAADPDATAGATAPVTPLGDLGDVTADGALRAAVDEGFARSRGPTELSRIAADYPCVTAPTQALGIVTPTAAGTGVHRGVAVTVLLGTTTEGRAVAVVARQDDCLVVDRVDLPG